MDSYSCEELLWGFDQLTGFIFLQVSCFQNFQSVKVEQFVNFIYCLFLKNALFLSP